MTNVPIIDQPRWPAMDAETTPAFMDFKLVFKATSEPVKYEDPLHQFRFEGFKGVDRKTRGRDSDLRAGADRLLEIITEQTIDIVDNLHTALFNRMRST